MDGQGERARNLKRFRWAGDPERWGGHAQFTARVPTSFAAAPINMFGEQVLRAQTEDLVAIAWDLAATYSVEGLAAGDNGSLALQFTLGTGQATAELFWVLATIADGVVSPQNPGAQQNGWWPTVNGSAPYQANALATLLPPNVVMAPPVPAGFRAIITTFSVTSDGTYDGSIYGPSGGGFGVHIPTGGGTITGPLDWVMVAGDTPNIFTFALAGSYAQVTLMGHLEPVSSKGVAVSASPLVAVALSARPQLILKGVDGFAHDVVVTVDAHTSPRSWVP